MITDQEIAFQRLSRQHIRAAQFDTPEEVVRWMGAMQAQDYAQAVWGIGARTRSATLTDVEKAIAEGKIIRTWPMRGTIHFIPPDAVKWMLKLSAARMVAADRRRQEQLDLNEAILERCKQLFYDVLHGGRRLSRPEMMTLLENNGIGTGNQRGYHILWYAAQTGLICLGPMQGKQQTFVLLEEWVPDAQDLPREEALIELARRYFSGHGPATVQDFAWWAGLPLGEARVGLAGAGESLEAAPVGDRQYWMAPGVSDLPALEPGSVFLLPGYDEYLLGYRDRGAVLAGEHADHVVPGGNGVFRPMLVVDGQVTGTWKRTVKKNTAAVEANPFMPIELPEEMLTGAAQRYSQFLGLPLASVTVVPL